MPPCLRCTEPGARDPGLGDLEDGSHFGGTAFGFKCCPLLDALHQHLVADVLDRLLGLELGGHPILNVGNEAAFHACRDEHFLASNDTGCFALDFGCWQFPSLANYCNSSSGLKDVTAASSVPTIFCQSYPRLESRYSKNEEFGSFNKMAMA